MQFFERLSGKSDWASVGMLFSQFRRRSRWVVVTLAWFLLAGAAFAPCIPIFAQNPQADRTQTSRMMPNRQVPPRVMQAQRFLA